MTPPADPYQAVTHPHPYPYYAGLVARPGLHRAPHLDAWIAADADTVREVLTSSPCRVRPRAEPVPAHLRDSPAAALFGRLVRMNDGAAHAAVKQALGTALLQSLDAAREESRRHAAALFAEPRLTHLPERALQLPVFVLGSLLGLADRELEDTVKEVDAYVRSVGAPAAREEGGEGAARLVERLASRLREPTRPPGLLGAFASEARRIGCAEDLLAPNAVGLLTQAYEATAGLVGAALLALAREPGLREQLARHPALLEDLVREAARFDAPVQNTRRFVAERATLAGQEVEEGTTVIVVLAAASRDARANPSPDAFLVERKERRLFTFGVGPHACPGEALAVAMASAAVERVLESGADLSPLTGPLTYRPSTNARVLGGLG